MLTGIPRGNYYTKFYLYLPRQSRNDMDKGKLKGHAALWVANLVWGLNAPIGKSVLWSEHNPGGVSPFALSVYRMLGACLLFWSVSLFLPR